MEAEKLLCCHFPDCGGCAFQDLSYPEQIRKKEAALKEIYAPFLQEAPSLLLPFIPAPATRGFRNKMEFSFSQDKAGRRYLGLFKKRGRVIDLSECPIAPGWFMDALLRTRRFWEKSGL